MAKELVDGREYFDGNPVEIYEIRFLGSSYMNEKDAAGLCEGDLVTFMVTARLGDPKFTRQRKTGELKRSNGAKIVALVPFDPEQAKFVYDNLGKKVEGVNEGIVETSSSTQVNVKEEQFDI